MKPTFVDARPGEIEMSVVIVSYNTKETTLQCLRELTADLGDVSVEIIVVDNASKDGSADAIQSEFPQVMVVKNPQNAGFGAANNLGMMRADGRYFFLLNSDAFVHAGALSALCRYLNGHSDVAVVGPRLLNADGSLQRSCYRFPSPGRFWMENLWISAAFANHPKIGDFRKWAHNSERQVDFVSGACLLVRRKAVEQVGGFDINFFMYSEETDWQRRMREAGWKVAFTPEAEVTHLGGASGDTETGRINPYFFDSLDRYMLKHHGWGGFLSFRLAVMIGRALRAMAWGIVALVNPRGSEAARAKMKFAGRVAWREATHWRNLSSDRRSSFPNFQLRPSRSVIP